MMMRIAIASGWHDYWGPHRRDNLRNKNTTSRWIIADNWLLAIDRLLLAIDRLLLAIGCRIV